MKKPQAAPRLPRLDARAWARLLAAQEKSGQSVKAYCAAQGISAASYYRWQKLLKQEEEGQAQFHPIEIQTKPTGGIVVELPGGVKLHFRELPPVAYLRSLSSSFSGEGI